MTTNNKKPANSIWTDDQWRAIVEEGQDMLVAAAAGSGKTAVLVERIINKIIDPEKGTDIDRLLIVTFTNAAAAEMRTRIGQAVEKQLKKQPDSLHLRRQLSLLNKAIITTCHSFCLSVVRKYGYNLDLDPAFRIADETETELIKEEAMEEVLEAYYGSDQQQKFYELVDRYSNDRSDDEIRRLVNRLYEFAHSHPWPDHWLSQLPAIYRTEGKTVDELPWTSHLLQYVRQKLQDILGLMDRVEDIARRPGGPAPYLDNVSADREAISQLIEASNKDWGQLYERFSEFSLSRLKPCKGDAYDDALKEQAKGVRENAKKELMKIKEEMFNRPPEKLMADLDEMRPYVELLVELVRDYKKTYQAAKKARGVVDFNDLEHFCLDILRDEAAMPGDDSPSDIAKQYRAKFQEVLIDEYQDTNLVQETILQLVSKTGTGNRFMVGDVKQSIYRFRLAEPALFLGKYKRFAEEAEPGSRIDLAKNFRSRREVIDATNDLFTKIMDESAGEIAYDEKAALKFGADYPDDSCPSELIVIDRREDAEVDDDEEDDRQAVELEAAAIADRIEQLIGKGGNEPFQVFDKDLKRYRKIEYRDITILLRAAQQWAPAISEVLSKRGIPVHAELSGGYFEAIEVAIMLSLLKTIDNPYQDIPLTAVLRSPIVGLNAQHLARVRLAAPDADFYHAVKVYIDSEEDELSDRLHAFHVRLSEWRNQARTGALSELIWRIYRETGYYDYVGGQINGRQRQANLRALYDRARQYEKTSFRGLFRFLRFVERLRQRGSDLGEARALSEQEDVVRIMTIHKSKGLEYPVVFAAGMNKQFNRMDLNQKALLHKNLGFGTKNIDPVRRVTTPTLPFIAMKHRMTQEMLAEEMRVLYVALTRAREKLILIGTLKKAEKTINEWVQQAVDDNGPLGVMDRLQAKTFMDWIGPAVINHKHAQSLRDAAGVESEANPHFESDWTVKYLPSANIAAEEYADGLVEGETLHRLKSGLPVNKTSQFEEEIDRRLSWSYPFKKATEAMTKQTVTEIKRQREWLTEGYDEALLRSFNRPIGDRPRFLQSSSLSAAEQGTAMHTLMQHLPLDKPLKKEEITAWIGQLIRREILTEAEASTIDADGVEQLFYTKLGERLRDAGRIHRELPFSLSLNAAEIYPNAGALEGEKVLVQGVIDCVAEYEDGCIVIDYKTDTLRDRFDSAVKAEQYMLNKYDVQLRLYKQAIETIWRKPVKEAALYAFDGGHYFTLPD